MDVTTEDLFTFFKVFQEVKRGTPIRRIEEWLHEGLVSGIDEAEALVLLSRREGGYRMGELAKDLHSNPANAARTARLLVREGYAVRHPASQDRRGVVLKLTQKGRTIAKALEKRRDIITKALFAQLSSSQRKAVFLSLQNIAKAQQNVADQLMGGNHSRLPE